MKRLRWIASLTLVTWCCCVIPVLAESPKDYVKGILDKVMAIQSDPALAGEAHEAQRSSRIHQIIARSFDFPYMAQDALGGAQLSGGQKQEFIQSFSYLFQDSYTRMVLKFLQKENITYKGEKLEGNKARVDTTIVRPNESIPVTYLVHQGGGGWMLYDVIVDGVSILQNYRTQFSQTIKTKGVGFLLERMKTQRQSIK
jgi:phospholipid transport system substrate-binding protein